MKLWLKTFIVVLIVAIVLAFSFILWQSVSDKTDEAETWVEIDNTVYGARPDTLGPIGGGNGYVNIITDGDYIVEDLSGLLNALAKAKSGEVIFIPGEIEIDMTVRIYIEKLVLTVPAGVTLAGDRGYNGSRGALLSSDALDTPVMIRAAGPDVRITGLRIQGPNPKRDLDHHLRSFSAGRSDGHEYYYKFPVSGGIETSYPRLEVDNCEISAFSHAAINLVNGEEEHIHHNFIHHCQYAGLGYGVCLDTASVLIEFNIFDWNRHSIAGTGRPGCSYVARNNIQGETSLEHCFDMHGGVDRGESTNVAGTVIEICNNTFLSQKIPVVIRGAPQEESVIHNNWFPKHSKSRTAIRASVVVKIEDNAYGENPEAAK